MSRRLLYIRAGKMYYTDGSGEYELPSETLRHYVSTTRERAKSKEWKTMGAGAAFMGDGQPALDAETVVGRIRSEIHAAVYDHGTIYYALTVDESSGIYKKDPADLSHEGIVLSDQGCTFEEFSITPARDKLIYTCAEVGEKHIGVLDLASGQSETVTEGSTVDSSPVCCPSKPDRILFSSCGLAEYSTPRTEDDRPEGPIARAALRGPASVCALDLTTREIETLLGDDSHDYLHPSLDEAGNLLCIRRPYSEKGNGFSLGCLVDILLFLPRLLWSLIQFLSVFSRLFSGKSLTGSTDVRGVKKSQTDLMIEGNRIKADEELKRNARAGEKNPGIIPRCYELIRLASDGKTTVLAKGVCAYLCDGDALYLSNGSAILRMRADGKTEEILAARGVTRITAVED